MFVCCPGFVVVLSRSRRRGRGRRRAAEGAWRGTRNRRNRRTSHVSQCCKLIVKIMMILAPNHWRYWSNKFSCCRFFLFFLLYFIFLCAYLSLRCRCLHFIRSLILYRIKTEKRQAHSRSQFFLLFYYNYFIPYKIFKKMYIL